MKHTHILYYGLITGLLLCASCQTEASKKADQAKADSLEIQTKRAADSAQKAMDEFMNTVSDSSIANDTTAPVKKEKK